MKMATKKNIVSVVDEYIPPRLVKAAQGWYVVFYHMVAGVWTRERKTFNLNRIRDKRQRMERVKEIIEFLQDNRETWVAAKTSGVGTEYNVLERTNAVEAIRFAADILCQSPRYETRKSFRMIEKMLVEFLEKKKLTGLAIVEFDAKVARAFMDAATLRGVSNTTYNNYRGFATVLFNKLINRDYIKMNPFHKIEKLEREEKTRRPFTAEERSVVLAELYEKDYWLFILVMLHFMCLIRRSECYRLRFSNFNLKEGYIYMPKTATKNKKPAVVTIPNTLLYMLRDEQFSKYPGNYLVFGKGGGPHPNTPAGDNTYKERHRRHLLRLQRQGLLHDIKGLSMYSWKDTGMTAYAKILRPIELRDHARHASIDQSLEYYHSDKLIEPVKTAEIKVE